MGLRSQNGWPVLKSGEPVWFTACGVRFAAANADVATIAKHFIERFHVEVEPITGGIHDDWSFAVRNVRGSTTSISNHSSATAWDLNAVQHPSGVRGTFTSKQATALRRLAASITDASGDRVLRLGMDYTTTVDDMHVEINAGERSVHQAAVKIRLKEDDMELTKTNLKDIADAVWSLDTIPNQEGLKANPNWSPRSTLSDLEATQDRHTTELREIKAMLTTLLSRTTPTVKSAPKT